MLLLLLLLVAAAAVLVVAQHAPRPGRVLQTAGPPQGAFVTPRASRAASLTSQVLCGLACAQNRRNTPERLELKKYNPHLKRMTVHREVK